MVSPNGDDRQSFTEQRRHRRFDLRYPVRVEFKLGTSVSELLAVSKNMSLGGILLEADSAIPRECDVRFAMMIRSHHIIGDTQITGEGEIVRVEAHGPGCGFAIAVECTRPISDLQNYFPRRAN